MTAVYDISKATDLHTFYEVCTNVRVESKVEDDSSWFSDWLNDKDKVSTDGKDDGVISLKEKSISFGKGLIGLVKGTINHPLATGLVVGGAALLTVASGGAALPLLTVLGALTGTGIVGYGAYSAATAKTDGEAKQAWENTGNGIFAILTSAIGAKLSLNSASKAGVTGAYGTQNKNLFDAFIHNFKILPEALKKSVSNSKENISIWSGGTLFANSNKIFCASDFYKTNDKQGLSLTQCLDNDLVDISEVNIDSLEISPNERIYKIFEDRLICEKGR